MSLNIGQVIDRALRMHGVIADGGSPSASVGADMLVAANAMKRAWFGALIGPRMSPQAFPAGSSSGQAETGGEYAVPGGAAFTLSAPLNPRSGARFGVVDGGADFGANPCTVQANGRLIAAPGGTPTTSAVLSTNGQAARWWFRGDNGTWTLEQDWPGLTSAIEFPDPIIAFMPHMLAVQIASEFGADITPEMAQGAMEGRQALARSYARRGLAALDGVIGLAAPPVGVEER
ncbi:MAG TPA: hypothetical protein VK801_07185 [Caulobacteraceae bacterium]|jgi:hypothetical protein|nr:hypothetical protein [Caulobacteraceae bacterium]